MEIFLAIVVILIVGYFITRAYSRNCVDGNCPCPEEVTPVTPVPTLEQAVPFKGKATTTKKVVKKVAVKKLTTKKV